MQFVNSLVHISNPIDEYRDFTFVPWDEGIYPQFKGPENATEVEFVFDAISSRNVHRVADFAVGKGTELSGVIRIAKENNIPIREDRDLVQILSLLDIGEAIPNEVHTAIAEILAFIYWTNQQHADIFGDD